MGPRELWLLLRIYCLSFITTLCLLAEMLMEVSILSTTFLKNQVKAHGWLARNKNGRSNCGPIELLPIYKSSVIFQVWGEVTLGLANFVSSGMYPR